MSELFYLLMLNPKRAVFIRIIREIAEELSLQMQTYSEDWIIKLYNKTQIGYIYLYSFGINSDSAAKLCTDKTATYLLLKENNVPSVKYKLIYPQILTYKGDASGNWRKILDFFYRYNQNIVIKPNKGSAGKEVFHITTTTELEQVASDFLGNDTAIVLSPFYEIENEFRIVMLEGEPLLVFRKKIPELLGDGKKNVGELLLEQGFSWEQIFYLQKKNISPSYVPQAGERIKLLWKHNLTGGASPQMLTKFPDSLLSLARDAVRVLGMRFASVDVIQTNKDFKVIEVNSGVTLVNFAMSSEKNYYKAKEVYKKAIKKWFEF